MRAGVTGVSAAVDFVDVFNSIGVGVELFNGFEVMIVFLPVRSIGIEFGIFGVAGGAFEGGQRS